MNLRISYHSALFFLLLFICLPLTTRAADALPNDTAKLEGSWKPTKGEINGQPMPEPALKQITLTIKGTNYDVTAGPEAQHDQGGIKYNTTLTPKAMDITGTNGPNKAKTILAIYDLQADTLRICYNLTGATHPTEFKTTAGTPLLLLTYQRQK